MSEFRKNYAEGVGEVSREIRTRTFGEGRFVSSINALFYDDADRRTWMNVVCWDDMSDVVSEWPIGTRFAVKGRFVKARDWTGSDGTKRRGEHEIYADEIVKLGKRTNSGPEKIDF